MGTSSKELERKLRKWTRRQHGCFTAAQAIETGYADSVHLYHVKNGQWIRVFRGVYRLAAAPETSAALRSGRLADGQPVQILVPKGFRRSSDVPDGIQINVSATALHKTSKKSEVPVEGTRPAAPPSIPAGLDAPDYYDWLDYQAVACRPNA